MPDQDSYNIIQYHARTPPHSNWEDEPRINNGGEQELWEKVLWMAYNDIAQTGYNGWNNTIPGDMECLTKANKPRLVPKGRSYPEMQIDALDFIMSDNCKDICDCLNISYSTVLDRAAKALKLYQDNTIFINGFTDKRKNNNDNIT